MSSLLELTQEAQRLTQTLIEADGELDYSLELALTTTANELALKIDKYYYFLKHLEMQEQYYKDLEDQAKRAKQLMQKGQENLKSRLMAAMVNGSTTELVGEAHRFKLQASKPRLVIDTEAHSLPEKYRIVETITRVNKEAIRTDLEDGIEVLNCRLEPSVHVRHYLNTKG